MSESAMRRNTRTPSHLWWIGGLALLWNAMGAWDYVMTETRNPSYMSGFTQEQLDFFYGLPAWVVSAWAAGVWGGVFGAVLLLARRRLAEWLLLASLAGVAVTTFRNYVLADGMTILGDAFSLVFTGVIVLFAIGLWRYAVTMRTRGVLV